MSDEQEQFAQYFEVHKPEGEPELLKMTYADGKLDVWAKHPNVAYMAAQLALVFDKSGATNYLETTLKAPDDRTFVITIQRKGGKTPHELRMEDVAAMRERCAKIADSIEDSVAEAIAERIRSVA